MEYLFDYVIPLCNIGGPEFNHRLKNIERTTANIPNNVHLILIEQVTVPNLPKYTDHINVPATKVVVNHASFNKMWLYNIGVRKSKTEHILLTDADVYFESGYFDKLSNYISDQKLNTWCFGWNNVNYLNESDQIIKKDTPRYRGSEGMIVYFNRSFFANMGMCNEWIVGVGGDDNELATRAHFVSNLYLSASISVNHQFHPYNYMNESYYLGKPDNPHQAVRAKNIKLIDFVRSNTNDVVRALIANANLLGQLWGPLDKYVTCPFL